MAAVIGDVITDHSRFHGMIADTGLHHDSPRSHEPTYHSSEVRNRPRGLPTSSRSASRARQASTAAPTQVVEEKPVASTGGASRFPSPPNSSSPTPTTSQTDPKTGSPSTGFMATQTETTASAVPAASARQPASPASDSFAPNGSNDSYVQPAPTSQPEGTTIKVRDLAHIRSLAQADLMNGGNGPGILNDPPLQAMKYEISGMPIGDIIEMVAALLTKITSTNDLQHDALHRNATHQQTAASHNNDGASMSPLSSSVLAFHGKNVPAITILNYLSRIHKYCPTTYEVFLSLLVYFDRMTERVNNMVMEAEQSRRQQQTQAQSQARAQTQPASNAPPPERKAASNTDVQMQDGGSDSDETDSDLADDEDDNKDAATNRGSADAQTTARANSSPATYFVVDSFNIHRLIIAGVTCASKFFSDVFYTNSRYAKVGGLPLPELNHLELQFLVLNDFRLCVPVEDLEAYATMLVEFYAREVVAQRPQSPTGK